MEEKKRSFTKLKNSMRLIEFESYCRKIAVQYANSDGQYSSSYFMKAENISKDCFYKILDEAVIRNLVADEIVDKMETKAVLNQKRHALNAGETSQQHYAQLRKKRNEYIIFLYSDIEIKVLAEDFAELVNETKADFAKRNGISTAVLDTLLKKAFTENLIDDETCRKIEKRSLAKDPSKRAKIFFEQLWERRENKENALN